MVDASLSLRTIKNAIKAFEQDEYLMSFVIKDKNNREVEIYRGV